MRKLTTVGFSSNPRAYDEESHKPKPAKSTTGRKPQIPKALEKDEFADLGEMKVCKDVAKYISCFVY